MRLALPAMLATCLSGVAISCATAGEVEPIYAGDRVRVSAPKLGVDSLVGEVQALDRDRIVLVDRNGRTVVPWGHVTSIEVSMGRESRALEGLAVGLALGAVFGGYADRHGIQYLGAVYGGAAGAALGLVLGMTTFGPEKWRKAESPFLSEGGGSPSEPFRVGLHVRFP